MATSPLGQTFAPTTTADDIKKPTPAQQAIQVLSMRLPRVRGARAISPLISEGRSVASRQVGGFSPESAVLQTLMQTMGQTGGSLPAGSMPTEASPFAALGVPSPAPFASMPPAPVSSPSPSMGGMSAPSMPGGPSSSLPVPPPSAPAPAPLPPAPPSVPYDPPAPTVVPGDTRDDAGYRPWERRTPQNDMPARDLPTPQPTPSAPEALPPTAVPPIAEPPERQWRNPGPIPHGNSVDPNMLRALMDLFGGGRGI